MAKYKGRVLPLATQRVAATLCSSTPRTSKVSQMWDSSAAGSADFREGWGQRQKPSVGGTRGQRQARGCHRDL